MRRMGAIAMVGLLLAAAVAGCGGGGHGSSLARRPPQRAAPTPPPDGGPPHVPEKRGPVPPRCDPTDLVVFHTGGGDSLSVTYFTAFTVGNLSQRACSISGYPRLTAIEADGRQIGGPAHPFWELSKSPRKMVTIPAEGTAWFRASWSEDDFGPGECKPTVVARYRVVLPGGHRARGVPFPFFERCTNAATAHSFSVGRIEPEPAGNHRLPGAPHLRQAHPAERLPRCRPSRLLVFTGVDSPAGVGLGTSYFRLDVANLSARACEISGTPRVVAVDAHGRAIGAPARRTIGLISAGAGRRHLSPARIGGHDHGAFMVATGSVFNYGRDACHFKMAAGLRVTLPGARSGQTVPMLIRRCPGHMGGRLSIGPVE